MKSLVDAHNHLQDEFFEPRLDDILQELDENGIGPCVVNGTREDDWPKVAALTRIYPDKTIPSFGLHPWYISDRSSSWLDSLAGHLEKFPTAGVGECGLDRWIAGHDLEEQRRVLLPQIELATTLNRPLTIHCLRAWGPLLEILQKTDLPERGFLLHAYSGSLELVSAFAKLGAYFSFSGYFLNERKKKQLEIFKHIPKKRLLIETDAPAMSLPKDLQSHDFPSNPTKNHPANLRVTFENFCCLLEFSEKTARELLDKNETSFFLGLKGH